LYELYGLARVKGSNQQSNTMSKFENIEEQLIDLWLSHVLPVVGAGEAGTPQVNQPFVLTGWRGAGWYMIFLEQ
jgi:hypothetical protein